MVNGIVMKTNGGYTKVEHVARGTEQELLDKIDELTENYPAYKERSYFDFKKDDWEREGYTVEIKEDGMTLHLDIESLFTSHIRYLLDYIRPHMMEVRLGHDGYFSSRSMRKKPSSKDIRFVGYNTRGGDDGIGGFHNQVMFEVRFYDNIFYEPDATPHTSFIVLCGYDAEGWEDHWSHPDYFSPERLLLAMSNILRTSCGNLYDY